MQLCGGTTLLDGKKMRTMKLCGVTTLLDGKGKTEDNEALWCHSIVVGKKQNEDNEVLWCHNIVEWEEYELGQ